MRKQKNWFMLLISIFIGLISSAVFIIYLYGPNFNFYLVPPSPSKYGDMAIEKMDRYGYFATGEKWQKEKKQAIREMNSVRTYGEADKVIKGIIKIAGGQHSQFFSSQRPGNSVTKYQDPIIADNDGIVTIQEPQFEGNNKEANQYANKISNYLYKHKQNVRGIIIELSNNVGGDMTPMILGLSPILPDGELFSFEHRNGHSEKIYLKNGTVNAGGTTVHLRHTLKLTNIPVAVVINHMTGSSGEITALSLKTNARVRFFGEPSAGFTSVNQSFPLYSGAAMYLTIGGIRDKTNKLYVNEPIKPDMATPHPHEEATKWINAQ